VEVHRPGQVLVDGDTPPRVHVGVVVIAYHSREPLTFPVRGVVEVRLALLLALEDVEEPGPQESPAVLRPVAADPRMVELMRHLAVNLVVGFGSLPSALT